ncbi:MAG: RagB/SusD family nutrient uptake outer membrane protein [Bacteroidales bacterium]
MKYTKYISACALLLTMNACNYLDLVPKGQSVIETVEDYNGLIESFSPNYDINNLVFFPQEAIHYKLDEVLSYKTPLASAQFLWDDEFDRAKYIQTDDLYNDLYKRIAKLNILLDGIDDAKGPDALREKSKAQARILRAYNYFFLVNIYAKAYDPATAATDRGIILRKDFNMESIPGQSTVKEVYDFIQKDIEEAIEGLPEKRENIYRPGKALAYALKAKVHLFKGELQQALDAALAVGQYDVALWDLETYADAKLQNPMVVINHDMPECLMHGNGSSSFSPDLTHVIKEVVDLYSPSDLRYQLFLKTSRPHPSVEQGSLCFGTYNKVRWNISGMRLSEVYLIIAECYARMGNASEAVKWINELRQYRFRAGQVVTVSAQNAAEARQLVINERRMELVLSINSFFDMKRYTVIPEYRKTLTKTIRGVEYSLSPDSHMYIMPFSIEAMESNPNLIQNSK